MKDAAKKLVSAASRWMTELQALPIEEAEAEYLRSKDDGDELLKQLQEHIEGSPARGKPFIHEGWLNEPQPTARLLEEAWRLQGVTFSAIPTEFQPNEISVLTNCAHSPDFRLIAGTEKFQTGFKAADFFAGQIDKYFAYIWHLDVERAGTFADVIAMSRVERRYAREVLHPCICVDELRRVIDYEAAWLLHSCCEMPEPTLWAIPSPLWLTERSKEPDVSCKSYYPGQLAKKLGCDEGTVATYAVKHARLPKRSIGEKDNPYSGIEVSRICEAILRMSRTDKHRKSASEILKGG